MAKPTLVNIESGFEGWDGLIDDNMDVLGKAGEPVPIPEHTGDQTDLESTYPAANYDGCIIMVNHTTLGLIPYMSDGTSWFRLLTPGTYTATTDNSTGTDQQDIADVGAVFNQAILNDIHATIWARLEELKANTT